MASSSSSLVSTQDLSSILAQVKGLEEEKSRLLQMLEQERDRLKEVQAKADRMSEGKRTEMRQALETVINNWLQDSVKDEKIRDEFKAGMTRLAEDAKDDAGVWQVVCCASNVHKEHLQEMERMRQENETLKARVPGERGAEFNEETARKRPRDEGLEKGEEPNIWLQFEKEISSGRTFGSAF
jgi:hypothetical protein